MVIENTIKKNIKHFDVVQNEIKYMNAIFNDIDNDKKIVIATMSATEAEKYNSILNDKYPTKKIYMYPGLKDDELKEEHFKNVEKYFNMADVLIYSSTVESGVNYN